MRYLIEMGIKEEASVRIEVHQQGMDMKIILHTIGSSNSSLLRTNQTKRIHSIAKHKLVILLQKSHN